MNTDLRVMVIRAILRALGPLPLEVEKLVAAAIVATFDAAPDQRLGGIMGNLLATAALAGHTALATAAFSVLESCRNNNAALEDVLAIASEQFSTWLGSDVVLSEIYAQIEREAQA